MNHRSHFPQKPSKIKQKQNCLYNSKKWKIERKTRKWGKKPVKSSLCSKSAKNGYRSWLKNGFLPITDNRKNTYNSGYSKFYQKRYRIAKQRKSRNSTWTLNSLSGNDSLNTTKQGGGCLPPKAKAHPPTGKKNKVKRSRWETICFFNLKVEYY